MKKLLLVLYIVPVFVFTQEAQIFKLNAVDMGFGGFQFLKGTVSITDNTVIIDYKKKSFADETFDLTIYEKVKDGKNCKDCTYLREYRSSNDLERIQILFPEKNLNTGTIVREIKDDFTDKIYKFTYLFKN